VQPFHAKPERQGELVVKPQQRTEDALLVQRCLDGDNEAFAGLVQAYEQTALATALSYVGDTHDASDVTQDAFLTAFTSINDLQNPEQFGSWFRRIVQRHALSRIRDSGRHTPLVDEHGATPPSVESDIPLATLSGDVSSAVRRLPMAYRDVVLMYYLNDLSYHDIAEIMDLPESTVRSRLRTARQKLKGALPRRTSESHDDHEQIRSAVQELVGKRHYRDALERLLSAGIEHIRDTLTSAEKEQFGRNVETILSHVTGIEDDSPCKADWGDAPDTPDFVGRQAELDRLRTWAVEDRARLVAVLGMGGIGKTALVSQFARGMANDCECIVWRSLVNAPPPQNVLADLIGCFYGEFATPRPGDVDHQLQRVMSYFDRHRCLIVLDNVEGVLEPGATGRFRAGYEAYGQLLHRIGESAHRSTLVITSREEPRDLARVRNVRGTAERTLELKGMDEGTAKTLTELVDIRASDDDLSTFVRHYSGNPLALKLVADKVESLFSGDLRRFLAAGLPLFEDVRDVLDLQFERLSPLERDVMYWLAIAREPSTPEYLGELLGAQVTAAKVLDALNSLRLRSLVERSGEAFGLQNVITEYVTDRIVEESVQEIAAGSVSVLDAHALILPTAKVYIQDVQRRLILERVADGVVQELGESAVEQTLRDVIESLRAGRARPNGYAAGNILNLVAHLYGEVVGWDFSHLPVRQADFTTVRVNGSDFARANFVESAFLRAHGGINWLGYHPEGTEIAMSSFGSISVLRAPGLEHVFTADGAEGAPARTPPPTGGFRNAAYASDGRLYGLVSQQAGENGGIVGGDVMRAQAPGRRWLNQVCDVRTGRLVFEYASPVVCTGDISRDGVLFALSDADFVTRVYDLPRKTCVARLEGHGDTLTEEGMAFHPDGSILATGSNDGIVRVWDIRTEECLRTFEGLVPHRMAFSADGTTLAISDWAESATSFVDWATGAERGRTAWFLLALGPDGRLAAGTDTEDVIWLWDLAKMEPVRSLNKGIGSAWAATFSPDGATLVTGEDPDVVRVWDVDKGQCIGELLGHRNLIRYDVRAGISPDGRHLAVGGDYGEVFLWSTERGRIERVLRREAPLAAVSKRVLEAGPREPGDDGPYNPPLANRAWDDGATAGHVADPGRLVSSAHRLPNDVVFSPDGDLVAAADTQGGGFRLWEMQSGKCVAHIRAPHVVAHLAFSPDSQRVAAHTLDSGGECPVTVWSVGSGELVRAFRWHSLGLAFSPDGRLMAGLSSRNGRTVILLWDVDTGRSIRTFEGEEEHRFWLWRAIAFSPDGNALGTSFFMPSGRRATRVWDVVSGSRLLDEPEAAFVGFDSAGRAVTVRWNTVTAWDVGTGTAVRVTEGEIAGLAHSLSGDGLTLITRLDCGMGTGVWDARTGSHINTLPHIRPYEKMNVTGATGLTDADITGLKRLGAVEEEVALPAPPEPYASPRIAGSDTFERRFASWAGGPRALASLVCVDVADRSVLSDRLEGNQRVRRKRARHAQRLRDLTERHNGLTIRDEGGRASIAFHTPTEALEFTREYRRESEADGIRLLSAIHVDSIEIEGEDPFGRLTACPAEILEKADPSGIWVSEGFKELLERFGPEHYRSMAWSLHPNCQLKGFPGKHILWSLADDATP